MDTILHISADFPDPLVPAKTKAVENLLAGTPGFRHAVYSLNRVSWRSGVESVPFGENRVALAYGAPPYGIALRRHLRPVIEAIAEDLTRRRIQPDLIHAHKFSVEGLIAGELAERTGAPFVASLWGDTDIKIFEAKRRLQPRYKQIAGQAKLLLPPAPWTQNYFERALGLPADRFELLPVITAADAMLPPVDAGAPRLVSVFSLDSWPRKNLDTLATAVGIAAHSIPGLTLDVFGSGAPKAFLDATRIIGRAGMEERIRLKGPVPHGRVQELVNRYAAFVLAARRETYGMVHVEALLAGIPILWSRDRGIDGLFDGLDIGCRCDPSSAQDVAAGIVRLVREERALKQHIGRLQREDAFRHVRRDAIAQRYREIVRRAIDAPVQSRSPLSIGMR